MFYSVPYEHDVNCLTSKQCSVQKNQQITQDLTGHVAMEHLPCKVLCDLLILLKAIGLSLFHVVIIGSDWKIAMLTAECVHSNEKILQHISMA